MKVDFRFKNRVGQRMREEDARPLRIFLNLEGLFKETRSRNIEQSTMYQVPSKKP
jgi:hypothetical protein